VDKCQATQVIRLRKGTAVSSTYQKTSRRAEPNPLPGEITVPEQVMVSMAEIARAAKEGLLALAVGTLIRMLAGLSSRRDRHGLEPGASRPSAAAQALATCRSQSWRIGVKSRRPGSPERPQVPDVLTPLRVQVR
jgi:hypothetical protein